MVNIDGITAFFARYFRNDFSIRFIGIKKQHPLYAYIKELEVK